MLFSSLSFLFVFFPAVFVLYYINKNRTYRNLVLLGFSLIFYGWADPKYLLLILAIVIITFGSGLALNAVRNDDRKKKLVLFVGVVAILSFLIYFKYTNFFIGVVNGIFSTNLSLLKIALPIGISFYSFQAVSYVIDLYRNKVEVQKNFFDMALYICLFPQLIAGPIVQYKTIEDEIKNRQESSEEIIHGVKRFIIGLGKKVLISNQMALIADTIYGTSMEHVGTGAAWIAALAYTFQIYYDFGGYSDMAIGLGQMFGFHFIENFNYPYIAKSINDFWRRWHISLSQWFRDYIYIPLGGNRVSVARHIFNMFVVWLLTGFWHGASWNYILWGLYYFVLLVSEKYLLDKIKFQLPAFVKWLLTFILVMLGWVLFRLENTQTLVDVFVRMFNGSQSNMAQLLTTNDSLLYSFIYFVPAVLFMGPWFNKIIKKQEQTVFGSILINALLIVLFMICVMFLTSSSYNPFIYFKF